jgi:catechol-2,3-dioxygenase
MHTIGTEVAGLGHINVRASADMIEYLRDFYHDIVGLREGPRPAFRSGSQGYWMYAGDRDIVHLTIDPQAKDVPPADIGTFNHIAFACSGLPATLERLRQTGIAFSVDQVDELEQVQLFFTDPTGLGIELTFSGEPLPI